MTERGAKLTHAFLVIYLCHIWKDMWKLISQVTTYVKHFLRKGFDFTEEFKFNLLCGKIMSSGEYKWYQVIEKSYVPMLIKLYSYRNTLMTHVESIENDSVWWGICPLLYWMEYFQHWLIRRFLHKVNLAVGKQEHQVDNFGLILSCVWLLL
jgi:hypothetical protein